MTVQKKPPASTPVVPSSAALAAKPPATSKTASPASAKLPARKAPIGKAVATKAAVKKAPLKKTASKALVSEAKAPALLETTALPANGKKHKLVRDSFTIPKAEYGVLDELKQRAATLAHPAKKSELLRAGIKILNALPDAAFIAALAQVPTVKTGRPPRKA